MGEILQREQPIQGIAVTNDFFGDPAFVEGLAAALRDALQAAGQFGLAMDLPGPGGLAVDQIRPGRFRSLGEGLFVGLPVVGDDRRYRVAVFGVMDGGCQQIGERQSTQPGVGRVPGVDGPRHGYRENALVRHGLMPPITHRWDRSGGGGAPRAVQGVQRAAGVFVIEQKTVPADARGITLHHRQHGGGGDGRVQGVAAVAQGFQGGLGGHGLAGAGDGPPGHDGGSAGV